MGREEKGIVGNRTQDVKESGGNLQSWIAKWASD